MAGDLGKNVLKKFGAGDWKGGLGELKQHASQAHSRSQSESQSQPQSRLPGCGVINDDERCLCSPTKGTYPRLARLHDGSILAAYTQFEGKERCLRTSRSTDNGRCFVDFGEVTRGAGDVDNLFVCEVAPNMLLGAFRNHDLGPSGPTHFRITVCQSTDGGKRWSFASQAAQKSAPMGIWEPFMRVGRQGEVQLTYSQEFAPDDQRTMLVVSRDQGKSWTSPVCVEGERERIRDGMNGIAMTHDNGREALVMVFETTRYGPFNIEGVVSYDDGATWQHRHEAFVPPRGHNAGAPQIASFGDGSLVVVFMTDEDSTKVAWTKHASIKAVFAGPPQHGKLSWSKPMTICKGASSWPGVMSLDAYTALATYDCGGPRARSISWRPT